MAQMNFSFADAITKTKPFFVMKSDANRKTNCFIGSEEFPMTEEVARAMTRELNKVFRKHYTRFKQLYK